MLLQKALLPFTVVLQLICSFFHRNSYDSISKHININISFRPASNNSAILHCMCVLLVRKHNYSLQCKFPNWKRYAVE